jgi:GNAT superfamily N-acetyltransferase
MKNELTVTTMQPEHLCFCAAIVFSMWDVRPEESWDVLKEWLRQENDSRVYVMLDGELVVGMCAFDRGSDVANLSPWILALWVAPEYRGYGYGQILVGKVLEHARMLGFTKIFLDTVDAQPYHARFGWKYCFTGSWRGAETTIMSLEL